MAETLGYAVLEVGGIQNFILGTGKLKEMIGGSQLIEELSKSILAEELGRQGISLLNPAPGDAGAAAGAPPEIRPPSEGEALALQRNAGEVHLLFPSPGRAKDFLTQFGAMCLERFPGLPLYGEFAPCTWSVDRENEQSIPAVKKALKGAINRQRNEHPASMGMGMLPICEGARLDGLPAVERDRSGEGRPEAVSLPSRTKRLPRLIKDAQARLRSLDETAAGNDALEWSDDMENLVGPEEKVAFIHMDGNDLGKLFRSRLESLGKAKGDVAEFIKAMASLSSLVERTTEQAFRRALSAIMRFERSDPSGRARKFYPARPLELGGDDVTVIVRADLALLFIKEFVHEFEERSRAAGTPLSIGIGMVICNGGYPFLKAFSLAEDLLKSAKSLTAGDTGRWQSSLDYVVITNDTETELDDLRAHSFRSQDGQALLTDKPLRLAEGALEKFVSDGIKILTRLPRSSVRPAMNECRKGPAAAKGSYDQLAKNIVRGLGGRHDEKLLSLEEFEGIFPGSYFLAGPDGRQRTRLGDFLELSHLLPREERLGEFLAAISGKEE